MTKWEVGRYLIEAKKNIDTLLFIERYESKISDGEKKKSIKAARQEFYINLTAIIDEYCNQIKIDKPKLLKSNSILKRIKYDRNKHEAHKDITFLPREYKSLNDMIIDMKNEIAEVKIVTSAILPEKITLDFIPYDRTLFRLIYCVNYEKEREMNHSRYLGFVEPADIEKSALFTNNSLSFFNDTEEIHRLSEEDKKRKVVLIENGLNLLEGIQNRQDSLICLNVLNNSNVWCSLTDKSNSIIELFLTLYETGVLNVNDMPNDLSMNNVRKIAEIFDKELK